MTSFNSLYDPSFRKFTSVDNNNKLITAEIRRVGGSGFGTTLDTAIQYTNNNVGSGGYALSGGVLSLTTGTTANSSAEIITKYKCRAEFGKVNNFRSIVRFQQSGAANNISYIRIYVSANTEFGYRTNGAASATNFEIYYKKGGSLTPVANGSFNGNGTQTNKTITELLGATFDPTVYNRYELKFSYSFIMFTINNIPIHTINVSTTTFVDSIVGNMSIYTVNSGGSTTNCGIDLIAWGYFQNGGVTNNPLYYCVNGVAETRTLKSGGGTLHAVVFGAKGAGGNTLDIYDNTAGSGTLLISVDLANVAVGSTMQFNSEGVNFYNGLTYVSTGTSAKFTFLWD